MNRAGCRWKSIKITVNICK